MTHPTRAAASSSRRQQPPAPQPRCPTHAVTAPAAVSLDGPGFQVDQTLYRAMRRDHGYVTSGCGRCRQLIVGYRWLRGLSDSELFTAAMEA